MRIELRLVSRDAPRVRYGQPAVAQPLRRARRRDRTTRSGQLRVIGHLATPTASGKVTLISAKSGGSVALGTLQQAGTPRTSGTVKTASLESEHDDDDDRGSKASDDDDKLCDDGDDVELEAEQAPGPEHSDPSEKEAPKASKSCDVKDSDHDGDDD